MLFSGCGIHIETIAQSPVHLAVPPADFGPSPASSQIFAPCVSEKAEPLKNAASAIADLLIGKDQYRMDCVPNPDTSVPLYSTVERAPRVRNPEPVDP